MIMDIGSRNTCNKYGYEFVEVLTISMDVGE